MTVRAHLIGLLAALAVGPALAQDTATADLATDGALENNGTDPTRPVRSATLGYETLELASGFTSQRLELRFSQPVGSGRSAIQLTVPFMSLDALGDDAFGLGDVGLRYSNVVRVTPDYGVVLQLEAEFPTAERDELGTGRVVLKPAIIYADFLADGSILAPSLLHNVSVGGDEDRADVNLTTFDLYYVPRLASQKVYMTLDPALNYDWEREAGYGAFAVTVGYRLGSMLGGSGQVFVKPSMTIGDERPVDWGLEIGFQVLNF